MKVILVIILFSLFELFNLDFEEDHKYGLEFFLKNPIAVMIMGSVVAPLLEESQFRLPLSKKRNALILPFFISLIMVIVKSLDNAVWIETLVYTSYLIFLLTCFTFHKKYVLKPKIAIFTTTIFFSLVHVFSYELHEPSFATHLLTLLAVSPQFIGGLMLAYIRIKFGFWYGVLFHGIWNFLIVSFILIPLVLFEESLL
ncbi:type II CAAX prenyl endopeptidase Rce1 family protein [Belliella marina]|uniref:Type II CAAX prenyl endopeptidase Rce1 family protein n=1 Tax=Belliella marina TaxID=1644146 RepID=A0ABW4VM19_9BACT